jgi:hypothetical protein
MQGAGYNVIPPQFRVGNQNGPFVVGDNQPASLGPHGEMLVSMLDAPYRAGVKNGEVFFGCNQAATTWSVALATTFTGLVLYNPVTAKKNLSILGVSFSLWAAPAGIVAVGLLGGWSAAGIVTHTTPASVYGAKTLAAATPSNGEGVDAAATLVGTPIWLCMLHEANTSAALPTGGFPVWHDIRGVYEVPPGGYIAIGSQTASSGIGSILWREVDP